MSTKKSSKRSRRPKANRNICDICKCVGLLLCCDSCPKAFHF